MTAPCASLMVWFTAEPIENWKATPRTTPGGQPNYSDLAITMALMLRAVFHLALRQTEGLIGSILGLLVRSICRCRITPPLAAAPRQ